MRKGIKNLPASVYARLRNHAREADRPFADYLQHYAIERFLYRLSQSDHSQRFVLKGGIVFFGWGIELRRTTRDIDLLGYLPNTVENVEQSIREICICPVEEDGLRFDPLSVVGGVAQIHARYEGVRIRFKGHLFSAVIAMQIDVGFGDTITPSEVAIEYPTILPDMPVPRLRGYSPETLIAEKLHAMVLLGSVNSRMNDFYDVWLLAQEKHFTGSVLRTAIENTFRNRHTPIPQATPVALTSQFAAPNQQQWQAFLRISYHGSKVSQEFREIVGVVKAFLLPPLQAAARGEPFPMKWKAGEDWFRR